MGKLMNFQFSMSVRGFFVCGAISIGNAFIDDIVVFGDALTEAYLGESKLARDPRIILTEKAVLLRSNTWDTMAIHGILRRRAIYYVTPTDSGF